MFLAPLVSLFHILPQFLQLSNPWTSLTPLRNGLGFLHECFAITTFAIGTFATRSMFIYQKCLVPVSSKQSSHSFSLGRFFELHMPFLFPVTKTNQYLIRFPKYLLELPKHLLFALLCVPIARQKRQRQTNK